MRYLRQYGSIPKAREAAKLERFMPNSSVWITALGRLLKEADNGEQEQK